MQGLLEGERKISTLEGMMMVSVAFVIYVIAFILDWLLFFIPGSILDILQVPVFWIWINLVHDIPSSRPSNIITPIVDFIPVVNLLPIWIVYIIWTVITARKPVEDTDSTQMV
jgi:hypothetical protein